MPNNIDPAAQAKRRKEAIQGTAGTILLRIAMAALLLWLVAGRDLSLLSSKLLLALAVFDLGTIVPLLILLKKRLKEIEGGEEDAAAEY